MSQAKTLLRRARICAARGDQEGALAAFTAVVALDPGDAQTRVNVGFLLADAGLRAEADQQFEHALALDPRAAGAWVGLAIGRQGADAIRCLDAALAIDPAYDGAWFLKHNVLRRLGDAAGAADCLARARALSPGTYG